MINHPMLLMRDPPPVIDVTRPAKNPTRKPAGGVVPAVSGLTAGETAQNSDSDGRSYWESKPGEYLLRRNDAPREAIKSSPSRGRADTESAAGINWHEVCFHPAVFQQFFLKADGTPDAYQVKRASGKLATFLLTKHWYIRRPTDAELALHWPEVLP